MPDARRKRQIPAPPSLQIEETSCLFLALATTTDGMQLASLIKEIKDEIPDEEYSAVSAWLESYPVWKTVEVHRMAGLAVIARRFLFRVGSPADENENGPPESDKDGEDSKPGGDA